MYARACVSVLENVCLCVIVGQKVAFDLMMS